MNKLEERYRRVLRLLPVDYRTAWEEEMVATYLDSVETEDPDQAEFLADYGRPAWAEVASVVALATRLRLGGAGAAPRPALWGHAVRRFALIGLLAQAVAVTGSLVLGLWLTGAAGWLPAPPEWAVTPRGFWRLTWSLHSLVWIAAYLALVLGQWRPARALVLLGVGLAAVTVGSDLLDGESPVPVASWLSLLLDGLFAGALAAFRDDSPPVRRRPWLIAFAVGVVLVPAPWFYLQATSGWPLTLVDWPALCGLAVVLAAGAHLLGRFGVGRRVDDPAGARTGSASPVADRAPAWSLALALAAAVVLGLRLVSLLDYTLAGPPEQRTPLILTGLLEAGALLAVAVPLVLSARRELRRPPMPAMAPGPGTAPVPVPVPEQSSTEPHVG